MAGNSVVKMGRLRKWFVVLVYALVLFSPCSCYDETHLLFLEQQSHERQAAQKRKERRKKKYSQDKQALQGPTDKSTNFASTTTSKTSKRKQPTVAQNELQPKPNKQRSTSQSQPDLALMFQKCQVLYEDDMWYGGTVTRVEFCDEKKQWMYKISFSDGETTLAAHDDPEVRFPF